jgi:hypothetical protein
LTRPLNRDRILPAPIEQVWEKTLRLVVQSDAIVNTIDPASRLISVTIPLKAEEGKRYLLDGKELPQRPQMAHIVIWARTVEQAKTRVFVRAGIGSAGIFLRSNGALEDEVFVALETGQAWRGAKPAELIVRHQPERVWRGALSVIQNSGFTLNSADAGTRLLTCTVGIPSDAVKQFAAQEVKGYYAAVAHVTLRIETTEAGARLTARSLMLEPGVYSPPALVSNGVLEARLLGDIERSLAGAETALKIKSDYKRNKDFWWTLFNAPPLSPDAIKTAGAKQQLPTSLDEAWAAALHLITQFAVINRCDRQAGIIEYIAAHPIKGESKYSVHQMAALLEANEFGVDVYVSGEGGTDSKDELAVERSELIEKIATQLFLKEKLKWLQKTQEKTK